MLLSLYATLYVCMTDYICMWCVYFYCKYLRESKKLKLVLKYSPIAVFFL